MKALLAEPMHEPQVIEIEDTLFAFQELLGNRLDLIEDFAEPIAVIFRERADSPGIGNIFFFCDTKGNTRYMISGKVLVVGVSGEYPCSLTDDQIKRFDRVFRSTVLYFRMQDERNDSNAKSEPPKQKKRKEDNRHERIGC